MLWPILWTLAVVFFVAFTYVIFFGAPFLPTLKQHVPRALDLMDLPENATILELGCGDGRVLAAAAERGWHAVGYELNPFLALLSWLRTRKYGSRVRVVCGNYWHKEWPTADGIFVFLLQPYMEKLDNKIIQYKHKPVKLVSFAFDIKSRKPNRTTRGLYLYEYKK